MSTARTRKLGPLVRGPLGRWLCRWCSREVQPPRRTFCGEVCVHEFRLRRDPGYLRSCVANRDHGICAVCGLDTEALRLQLRQRQKAFDRHHRVHVARREAMGIYRTSHGWKHFSFHRFLERIGGKILRGRLWNSGGLWDADHIVPVCHGGGECGLEGIQTLCLWCHQRLTAELAATRASARDPERDRLPLFDL